METVVIKGNSYTLGVDAFKFNGKAYRKSMCFQDSATGMWIPKSILKKEEGKAYQTCIIDDKDNIGFSSQTYLIGNTLYCKKVQLEPSWVDEGEMVKKGSNSILKSKKDYFGGAKYYTYDEVKGNFMTTPKDFTMSEQVARLAKMLDDNLTFGLEYETSAGYLLPSILKDTNTYPVYDGSIRGHEYITAPIKAKDFGRVETLCNYLKERTLVDALCSFHIHVSGMEFTTKEKVAFYTLITRIQDDLLLIVPPYKSDPKFFTQKLTHGEIKDHCAPLPKWTWMNSPITNYEQSYKELFYYFGNFIPVVKDKALNEGYINNIREKFKGIPKWNHKTRYHNVNFLNLILLNQDRFEFRLAEPVKTIEDTMYWLLFVQSLITYTKLNCDNILLNHKEKILIEDVLDLLLEKDKFFGGKMKSITSDRKQKNLEAKYHTKDNMSNNQGGSDFYPLNLKYKTLNN